MLPRVQELMILCEVHAEIVAWGDGRFHNSIHMFFNPTEIGLS